MLNTFCKNYQYKTNIISFTCSPDKVNIDNLHPELAYFQSLASHHSTCECQLPWVILFLLSIMVELVLNYEL